MFHASTFDLRILRSINYSVLKLVSSKEEQGFMSALVPSATVGIFCTKADLSWKNTKNKEFSIISYVVVSITSTYNGFLASRHPQGSSRLCECCQPGILISYRPPK